MDQEECRRRILYGQRLTNPADPVTVCRSLNGVQAQFFSSALHGLKIRGRGGSRQEGNIEYKEGRRQGKSSGDLEELVKSWTIRGTIHIFAREDLPLYLHENRIHYLRPVDQMVEDECISLERKQFFAEYLLDCIGRGIEEREELKRLCFGQGMTKQECESVFNSWGGTLRNLAEAGKICYRVQEKKAFMPCPEFTPMKEEAARLEMARRYFTSFGPATVKDAAYYFGAPQRQVRQWLAELPVVSGVVEGRERFWIDNGRKDWPGIPKCMFLAGFDQLMLGYEKKESLFLEPEHLRGIFSLSGIVMPAVLLEGMAAGRWKRKGSKLELTMFRPVTAKEKQDILEEAGRQWGRDQAIIFS